jgi:hypothetical protein
VNRYVIFAAIKTLMTFVYPALVGKVSGFYGFFYEGVL